MFNLVYKDASGKELRGKSLPGKSRKIQFEDGTVMSGSTVYLKLECVGKLTFDGDLVPARKRTKNHRPWRVNPVNGFKYRGTQREEETA